MCARIEIRRFLPALALLVAGRLAAGQTVIYVNDDAAGANDGSSWPNAYLFLQDALDAATNGVPPVEIWVAAGTYRPDETTATPSGGGSRSATFQLLSDVPLYGGFEGEVDEISLDQRNVDSNATILSGDLAGNDQPLSCTNDQPDCNSNGVLCVDGACIQPQGMDENSFHVVTCTVPGAVLDGFTIRGGHANGAIFDDRIGGGLALRGSLTIRNCRIVENASLHQGGGLDVPYEGATLAIEACLFERNFTRVIGGALNFNSNSVIISDSVFRFNSSGNIGGAAWLAYHNSSPATQLVRCTFEDNVAAHAGAIVSAIQVVMTDCLFQRNRAIGGADGSGGALYLIDWPQTFLNCRFLNNTAVFGGAVRNQGGNAVGRPGHLLMENCEFTGNTAQNGSSVYNSQTDGGSTSNFINCTFDDGGPRSTAGVADYHGPRGAPIPTYTLVQAGGLSRLAFEIGADQGTTLLVQGTGESLAVSSNGVALAGADGITLSGPASFDSGGRYQGQPGASAGLAAASLSVADYGSEFRLSDSMTGQISGPLDIVAGNPACALGERGCTPPLLRMTDLSSLDAGSLSATGGVVEIGGGVTAIAGAVTLDSGELRLDNDATITVGGDLRLQQTGAGCRGIERGCTPALLEVAGLSQIDVNGSLRLEDSANVTVGPGATFTLAGDFDNQSTASGLFDWDTGPLTLDGTVLQAFETAGADRGPSLTGFDDNFALGRLEIVTGADVRFADIFDNDLQPQTPCGEALYVRRFLLRAGSSVTLDNARVYYGQLVDEGGAVTSIGCGELRFVPTGDSDADGDLDAADYAALVPCFSGPDAGQIPPQCATFDFDQDGDLDAHDFAVFQAAYTGP